MFAVSERKRVGRAFALVLVLWFVAACTPAQPPPAGIPESLWNKGTADPLEPLGLPLGQEPPKAAPIAGSYDKDLDRIGDWRLLEINDSRVRLVIQYSQGGACDFGQGVLVAQADSAVALVPIYRSRSGGTPCDAVAIEPIGVITLDEPLGDRKLLHLPADGSKESPK